MSFHTWAGFWVNECYLNPQSIKKQYSSYISRRPVNNRGWYRQTSDWYHELMPSGYNARQPTTSTSLTTRVTSVASYTSVGWVLINTNDNSTLDFVQTVLKKSWYTFGHLENPRPHTMDSPSLSPSRITWCTQAILRSGHSVAMYSGNIMLTLSPLWWPIYFSHIYRLYQHRQSTNDVTLALMLPWLNRSDLLSLINKWTV